MHKTTIQFRFDPAIPFSDAVDTLRLARMAAASLVGDDRLLLEAPFQVDREARTVTVSTTGKAGRIAALIYAGLARREFGPQAVSIEHALENLAEETAGAVA